MEPIDNGVGLTDACASCVVHSPTTPMVRIDGVEPGPAGITTDGSSFFGLDVALIQVDGKTMVRFCPRFRDCAIPCNRSKVEKVILSGSTSAERMAAIRQYAISFSDERGKTLFRGKMLPEHWESIFAPMMPALKNMPGADKDPDVTLRKVVDKIFAGPLLLLWYRPQFGKCKMQVEFRGWADLLNLIDENYSLLRQSALVIDLVDAARVIVNYITAKDDRSMLIEKSLEKMVRNLIPGHCSICQGGLVGAVDEAGFRRTRYDRGLGSGRIGRIRMPVTLEKYSYFDIHNHGSAPLLSHINLLEMQVFTHVQDGHAHTNVVCKKQRFDHVSPLDGSLVQVGAIYLEIANKICKALNWIFKANKGSKSRSGKIIILGNWSDVMIGNPTELDNYVRLTNDDLLKRAYLVYRSIIFFGGAPLMWFRKLQEHDTYESAFLIAMRTITSCFDPTTLVYLANISKGKYVADLRCINIMGYSPTEVCYINMDKSHSGFESVFTPKKLPPMRYDEEFQIDKPIEYYAKVGSWSEED